LKRRSNQKGKKRKVEISANFGEGGCASSLTREERSGTLGKTEKKRNNNKGGKEERFNWAGKRSISLFSERE